MLREKDEKYRDMKTRFEFKVHERDTQINELRSNLQFYQLQLVRPVGNTPLMSPNQSEIMSMVNNMIDKRMNEISSVGMHTIEKSSF
jgi:hypothetical protein